MFKEMRGRQIIFRRKYTFYHTIYPLKVSSTAHANQFGMIYVDDYPILTFNV